MQPFSWSSPWYAYLSNLHYLFVIAFFAFPFAMAQKRVRQELGWAIVLCLICWCLSLFFVVDAYALVTSLPQSATMTLIEKHAATNPNRSRTYELRFDHDPQNTYVVPKVVYDSVETAQCYRVTTRHGYWWNTITALAWIPCSSASLYVVS